MMILDPKLKDGAGNNPRVDHLVETIDQDRERIIVPTPALSELLVGAKDAAPQYLNTINRSRYFRIEPFGERAAVEAAAMTRDAIGRSRKLGPAIESSWAKVKFDRQIVAIGRVAGASVIYSQDPDVARHAKEVGIKVLRREDLPDPPTPPQIEMTLDPPEPAPPADPDETE